MKNSFSLLEIILTLIISSIVIIYSSLFTKNLFITNKYNHSIETTKTNALFTKIFFEKHKYDLDDFKYENKSLYFKNSLLLENIKEFNLEKNTQNIIININIDDIMVQTWKFKL